MMEQPQSWRKCSAWPTVARLPGPGSRLGLGLAAVFRFFLLKLPQHLEISERTPIFTKQLLKRA
jgi:hypothetical protein